VVVLVVVEGADRALRIESLDKIAADWQHINRSARSKQERMFNSGEMLLMTTLSRHDVTQAVQRRIG